MAERFNLCCVACDGDQDIVLSCSSGLHTLCVTCVKLWLRSKTSETNSFNYKCPLYSQCGSELDPNLVFDIVFQTPDSPQEMSAERLQTIEMNSAVRDTQKISCPNCSYFYMADSNPNDSFEELFADCPVCDTSFCLTCCHSLGRYGYRDHVCYGGDTSHDMQRTRHDLAEILTDATTFRCQSCLFSVAITKQDGDCNAIKCTGCSFFFCYICGKDLGSLSMRAHESFPHANEAIPNAPDCWLFDDIELNKTMEEAIDLRKIFRVNEYFNALKMSRAEKEKLLVHCEDLLGNLRDKTILYNDENTDCTIL